MKRPGLVLIASVCIMLLTPFAVFPEIMTDFGPRNIAAWRNWLAIALLTIAAIGVVVSLATLIVRRLRASRAA